jgi:hypothetical protein
MPAKSVAAGPIVVGVRISHPERLIYPDQGISKLQLARYYESIADWIAPHVKGRPPTLVHCPSGLAAPCLYMKDAKEWGPNALRRVKIQEKTKVGEVPGRRQHRGGRLPGADGDRRDLFFRRSVEGRGCPSSC